MACGGLCDARVRFRVRLRVHANHRAAPHHPRTVSILRRRPGQMGCLVLRLYMGTVTCHSGTRRVLRVVLRALAGGEQQLVCQCLLLLGVVSRGCAAATTPRVGECQGPLELNIVVVVFSLAHSTFQRKILLARQSDIYSGWLMCSGLFSSSLTHSALQMIPWVTSRRPPDHCCPPSPQNPRC